MKTGKFFKSCAVILSTVFTAGSLIYAAILKSAVKIPLGQEFCFLVSSSKSVEACVLDVKKSGGAGYLLEDKNGEKVAVSVYFSDALAQDVMLENKGVYDGLGTLAKRCDALYLTSSRQKRLAGKIRADFANAYQNIVFLNSTIEELENGATQESIKRSLGALKENLSCLSKVCVKELVEPCKRAESGVAEAVNGVVTASSLRYVLCEFCDDYAESVAKYRL